jgi:hypothetical protein
MNIHRSFNRKVVLGTLALVCAALFIIIASFFPFIIDPNQWGSDEFISDELIIIAIVLFSVMAAVLIGQSNNAQNPKSELAKSKVKFIEKSGMVDDISRFCQWVKRILQPRDIKDIKERKMRSVGIDDYRILDLEISEIKSLKEGPKKINGRVYPELTKRQIDCLLNLKEGKLNIRLVEPMYYLTVKAIDGDKTISERSGSESVKKVVLISWSAFSRVVVTLVSTMIFAALVYDSKQEVNQAAAWVKFISRMFAMISSIFTGYLVGSQINDIDADYINMRTLVITQYLQDTTFVVKSEEELAEEKYKQLELELGGE